MWTCSLTFVNANGLIWLVLGKHSVPPLSSVQFLWCCQIMGNMLSDVRVKLLAGKNWKVYWIQIIIMLFLMKTNKYSKFFYCLVFCDLWNVVEKCSDLEKRQPSNSNITLWTFSNVLMTTNRRDVHNIPTISASFICVGWTVEKTFVTFYYSPIARRTTNQNRSFPFTRSAQHTHTYNKAVSSRASSDKVCMGISLYINILAFHSHTHRRSRFSRHSSMKRTKRFSVPCWTFSVFFQHGRHLVCVCVSTPQLFCHIDTNIHLDVFACGGERQQRQRFHTFSISCDE